jgi:hypothetical protein
MQPLLVPDGLNASRQPAPGRSTLLQPWTRKAAIEEQRVCDFDRGQPRPVELGQLRQLRRKTTWHREDGCRGHFLERFEVGGRNQDPAALVCSLIAECQMLPGRSAEHMKEQLLLIIAGKLFLDLESQIGLQKATCSVTQEGILVDVSGEYFFIEP